MEIPPKYQAGISNDDISLVLEAAAQQIMTFDGKKYEKIRATLSLEENEMRGDIWIDRFLFELEGYRDDRVELWQIYMDHPRNKTEAYVTRVQGGGTLIPDQYLDSAWNIILADIDKEVLARTPEVLENTWIRDRPGFVVFKLKDPDSPAHTIVTVDLNRNRLDSVERTSWDLSFPIYFNITSEPAGADVHLAKYSPELCGPPPMELQSVHIGRTPLTFRYEYNETFLPFSGLFSLFSFNMTGYEEAFRCVNIRGDGGKISVAIFYNGYYLDPVSENTYNITARLQPVGKTQRNIPDFRAVSILIIVLLVYVFKIKFK